jgi:hypothetical protein
MKVVGGVSLWRLVGRSGAATFVHGVRRMPVRWLRISGVSFASMIVCLAGMSGAARAQDVDAAQPPSVDSSVDSRRLPDWLGPGSGPTWRVGAYVGALTHETLLHDVFEPWQAKLDADYIADIHAIYTVHQFESIPLDLEIEGGVAQRFGQNHQTEFDLIPTARWKWFPWNNLVYTNMRLGLIGVSYVTGVSRWEMQNSGNNKGSKFLNLLIPEVTFSPGPKSPWEAFVLVHHRSGIYGMINGDKGGSNYPAIGLRVAIR